MPNQNNMQSTPSRSGVSNRGFASMDQQKQRAIASKGGQAAHLSGRAHEFDSSEAAEAGRKGGLTVSRDRRHMAEIGALGGRARGLAHQRRMQQLQAQQHQVQQIQAQQEQQPQATQEKPQVDL